MDILQQINFDIYEKFALEKIDFAFPTQTLIFNKPDA
jgi:small-conductance mechanosensitive channel